MKWTNPDYAPCVNNGMHVKSQRHARIECSEDAGVWPYWEISFRTWEEGHSSVDFLVWGWSDWQAAHDFALTILGKTGHEAITHVQQETDLCDGGLEFHEDCVISMAVIRKMLSVPSPTSHPILSELTLRLKEVAA